MNEEGGYSWVGAPVHKNRWQEDLQQAVSGWEYNVRDLVSGAIVPVFIPDNVMGKEQAQLLILHELQKLRDVHSLASG